MSNPSIVIRPNRLFNIFINFNETYVQKIIFAWYPGDNDNIILQSLVRKVLWHISDHYLSYCILLYIVTTDVLKHFVSYPCDNDNMIPGNYVCIVERHFKACASILLYIVKTYVCITILTYLRHAQLCV